MVVMNKPLEFLLVRTSSFISVHLGTRYIYSCTSARCKSFMRCLLAYLLAQTQENWSKKNNKLILTLLPTFVVKLHEMFIC